MNLTHDILYVNEKLLTHLVNMIEDNGIITKLTKSRSKSSKKTGNILLKWCSLNTGFSQEKSSSNGLSEEYAINCHTVGKTLISNRKLIDSIPNYYAALEGEKRGKTNRFIMIQGYITWCKSDNDKNYSGDIVIYDSRKPNNILNQHIVHFNDIENKVPYVKGTHCRSVYAITFWENQFHSKMGNKLSECEAIIVWDN
ncbi:MAG: hypothetical protein HQ557_10205 [Bacteroidetes bacterium]|nr:hypothetical protein [Bacteroidota bacterium]